VRREHRPLYVRRAKLSLERRFAQHFLYPHFDRVGAHCQFENPWCIRAFGPSIEIGQYVKITANADQKVRLAVWPAAPGLGRIRVGDYSVLNPGVCINSTCGVEIGRNAIFAAHVYVTDADWHGVHDRVYSDGGSAPVVLEDNVWVGQGAIIGKGVTIGENSIIGAGSVVVKSIPKNSIAAGNPATVVKQIDPSPGFISREHVFREPDYFRELERIESELLGDNTLRGWLRYLLFPTRRD
jgi:acetyltransferase-like isoleucine patch superfamily enzyme